MKNFKTAFLKFLMTTSLATGLVLGIAACGDHTIGSSSTSLSYSIDENGCKYSSPTFDSQSDYCNALETGSANKDPTTGEECGEDIRQGLFASNCGGTWTPTE